MADTEIPQTPPAADSSAAAAPASAAASSESPAGATPAVSSEATASSSTPNPTSSTSAPVEAAAAPVTSTPDAKAADAAPAAPAPSLLATEPEVKLETKVEEKKIDEKKPEAKTETKPEGEKVELPKYEALKMPEGFKADEKVIAEVDTLFGQLELAKGDNKAIAETRQKLFDLHASAITNTVQNITDYYKQAWEQQKADDFKALQKDPVLGGSGKALETTARSLANFLAKSGGTKEEVTEFRKFVQARGVDNALPIARVLNNLRAKIEGYEKESSKMLPGAKPQPSVSSHPGKGMIQKMYGNTKK